MGESWKIRGSRMLSAGLLVLLLGAGSGRVLEEKSPMVRSRPFLEASWEEEAGMPLALGRMGTLGEGETLRESSDIMRLYYGTMALALVGLFLIFFEPWNSGPKSSLKK